MFFYELLSTRVLNRGSKRRDAFAADTLEHAETPL
jgi:hypothetical protein